MVLQSPNNIPLEYASTEACIAMTAAVPAAADTGDVQQAKQTVLTTAQHLQVGCAACTYDHSLSRVTVANNAAHV